MGEENAGGMPALLEGVATLYPVTRDQSTRQLLPHPIAMQWEADLFSQALGFQSSHHA